MSPQRVAAPPALVLRRGVGHDAADAMRLVERLRRRGRVTHLAKQGRVVVHDARELVRDGGVERHLRDLRRRRERTDRLPAERQSLLDGAAVLA